MCNDTFHQLKAQGSGAKPVIIAHAGLKTVIAVPRHRWVSHLHCPNDDSFQTQWSSSSSPPHHLVPREQPASHPPCSQWVVAKTMVQLAWEKKAGLHGTALPVWKASLPLMWERLLLCQRERQGYITGWESKQVWNFQLGTATRSF